MADTNLKEFNEVKIKTTAANFSIPTYIWINLNAPAGIYFVKCSDGSEGERQNTGKLIVK